MHTPNEPIMSGDNVKPGRSLAAFTSPPLASVAKGEIAALGSSEPHRVARQPLTVFFANLEIGPVVDAAVQP